MRIYESLSKSRKKWLIRALIAGVVVVLASQASSLFSGLRLKSSLIDTNDSVVPIFVTSQQFTGKVGGVDKAKEICQRSAEIAVLSGTWEPLLGSHSESITEKLQPLAGKKFARFDRNTTDLNSIVVADNVADLLQGNLKKTLDLNEYGQTTTNTVWTGFTQGGVSTEHFCQEGVAQPKGTVGLPNRTDFTAFDTGTPRECNKRSSFYCYRKNLASPDPLISPQQEIQFTNKPAKTDVALTVPSALSDLGISNLTINPANAIGNVDARIFTKALRRLDTSAIAAPRAPSSSQLKIVRTFEMTPNRNVENSNPSGSFEFKMTKRELDQLGLAPADVKVGKFHNGKWKKLTPVLASETDVPEKTYTFKVTFSEFSTFIISNDFSADPFCGDGAVNQSTEICDDGNTLDGDRCSATCQIEPFCGDTIVQAARGEQCDGTNSVGAHQRCTNQCVLENVNYCGDGVKQSPNQEGINEACDGTTQTMTDNHQQCKQDCSAVETLAWCGDGITNGSEGCDNPDRTRCTALCTIPPRTETSVTKPASAQPGETIQIRFEIRKKANP